MNFLHLAVGRKDLEAQVADRWNEVDDLMREAERIWKTRNDYTMFTEGPQKDFFRCLLYVFLRRQQNDTQVS